MAFSYNAALLTDLDRVRFHIGDTVSAGALFQDETIDAILVGQPDVRLAAAQLALAAAAKYSRSSGGTKRIGGTLISHGDLAAKYRELAKELQSGEDGTGVPTLSMSVGGISQAVRDTLLDNTGDTITPSFSLRQHDRDGGVGVDGDDHGVD